MAVYVQMPQLGLTMTEGTVVKWHKREGETVAAGEELVEITTDKITNVIEAPGSGVLLKILVPEGETVPVKAALALIGEPGEKAADLPQPAGEEKNDHPAAACETPVQFTAEKGADSGVKASPAAKKLARELGIDLSRVKGSGPDGRIVERDVLACREQKVKEVKATPVAAKMAAELGVELSAIASDKRIMKDDVLSALQGAAAAAAGPAAGEKEDGGTALAGMRKAIAERMSLSWKTAPHVNLTVEVDMTAAGRLKDSLSREDGVRYSYTEVIVKCVACALAEFREVNSSLQEGRIKRHSGVNIGVAVALDNGLIVPVIKNAEQKSLRLLRQEIAVLSEKARKGELLPDEVSGGTFTVTNLGMYGADHFTPIINPPESAILGVCRVAERPAAVDGSVVIRPLANLCLSFDHRLIDGALAARFMARVRRLLEDPLLLLGGGPVET
ncbi:MAG: dihydrolipoamide acetyltransferase family protein [Peptococcaceae bacterium]|jgi:pyruvate dehydrogenase E2 component (dihydrolipoamide acetyltransferase)|nr:2-oxo acid dehydrogenase subunit E2 [Peptococcaceae bacterium]MDH7525001.1 dihydrolipoamide acetyltransferase family protein [Peptococcaceae bacterium]